MRFHLAYGSQLAAVRHGLVLAKEDGGKKHCKLKKICLPVA